MPNRTWKDAERRVAQLLGGRRNPLSGSASAQSAGDVLHPVFYIEVKQRKRWSLWSLWADTNKQARREEKTPVVAIAQKNHPGVLLVVHSDHLADFISGMIGEA